MATDDPKPPPLVMTEAEYETRKAQLGMYASTERLYGLVVELTSAEHETLQEMRYDLAGPTGRALLAKLADHILPLVKLS